MYGVIAVLDEKTECIIKDIWHELKERSISFYAEEVFDRRPHITLASYNRLNILEYQKHMDEFYVNKPMIDISFQSIGSFLNSGALYYAPVVTKELIVLHSKHHQHFEQFNDTHNSIYSPNKWIPHCTLANRLSPEKLSEAFNYCSRGHSTIHGKIIEIAMIEIVNQSAPVIYSKKLEVN